MGTYLLAIFLTIAAWSAVGQEGAVPESKADLRRWLAAAKTPKDHAKLADYFYSVAMSYAQQQAEEEQIAARWQKQYENWSKTPNPYRSALNLAGYFRQMANDAMEHARQQDRLGGAGTRPAQ